MLGLRANSQISKELELAVFPFRAKFIGLGFMILALPFGYLYFFGGKPDIFNIKVFVIISAYLENSYFVMSQTNALDELAAIFFISGISLVSFSKEKIEKEHYKQLRIKALINSLFFTILFWLCSFIFIYGMAIIILSLFILILFLIMYNVLFRYYMFRNNVG